MRICDHCGSRIPDGELICPKCSNEVQLVPDYETMESRIEREKMRMEEAERIKREQMYAEEMAALAKKKANAKKWKIFGTTFLLLLLIALGAFLFGRTRASSSFQYQYEKALKAYEAGEYREALNYAKKAVSLDEKSAEAGFLLGQIYEKTDNSDLAADAYAKVIENNANYAKAYERGLPLLADQKKYDMIRTIIKNCTNKDLLETYKDYITYTVEFNVKGGAYQSLQTLKLSTSGDGSIRYTTDGSDPTETSTLYSGEISLGEGKTSIKAIYYSPIGIPGEISEQKYEIKLETPPAPVITPASGTYNSTDQLKITVEVPNGYTAYYAFDKTADANSTKYTGPVNMQEGSHVFSAILVSDSGKAGSPASATFVFTKKSAQTDKSNQTINPETRRNPMDVQNNEKPENGGTVTPNPSGNTGQNGGNSDEEEGEWSYEP